MSHRFRGACVAGSGDSATMRQGSRKPRRRNRPDHGALTPNARNSPGRASCRSAASLQSHATAPSSFKSRLMRLVDAFAVTEGKPRTSRKRTMSIDSSSGSSRSDDRAIAAARERAGHSPSAMSAIARERLPAVLSSSSSSSSGRGPVQVLNSVAASSSSGRASRMVDLGAMPRGYAGARLSLSRSLCEPS